MISNFSEEDISTWKHKITVQFSKRICSEIGISRPSSPSSTRTIISLQAGRTQRPSQGKNQPSNIFNLPPYPVSYQNPTQMPKATSSKPKNRYPRGCPTLKETLSTNPTKLYHISLLKILHLWGWNRIAACTNKKWWNPATKRPLNWPTLSSISLILWTLLTANKSVPNGGTFTRRAKNTSSLGTSTIRTRAATPLRSAIGRSTLRSCTILCSTNDLVSFTYPRMNTQPLLLFSLSIYSLLFHRHIVYHNISSFRLIFGSLYIFSIWNTPDPSQPARKT